MKKLFALAIAVRPFKFQTIHRVGYIQEGLQ